MAVIVREAALASKAGCAPQAVLSSLAPNDLAC